MNIVLSKWLEENQPKKKMCYENAFWGQVEFMRRIIRRLLWRVDKELGDREPNVISTHNSKSIKLPVYSFDLHGVQIIIRDNFHDWKITVNGDRPIIGLNFLGLFAIDKDIHPVYCEGFEEEWVFQSYAKDCSKFTVEVMDEHDVYAFLKILEWKLRTEG